MTIYLLVCFFFSILFLFFVQQWLEIEALLILHKRVPSHAQHWQQMLKCHLFMLLFSIERPQDTQTITHLYKLIQERLC